MDDQPAGLVCAVREAAAEEEDVDAALDLAEHEGADGRERVPLVILLLPKLTRRRTPTASERGELEGVVAPNAPARTHVRQRFG